MRSAHTNTHTPQYRSQEWRAKLKPEPKHTHPHREPQQGVAGYKRGAQTNTHTPEHPSQVWRGAAETRAQASTPPPHITAGSGGVQVERAHKHSHTGTPQPGVARRSQNRSPSTHTHGADPSQEWRGTSGARTETHTHPNTQARSGGAQPKPEPKRTHRHRTPEPGVAGYRQSTHTFTHWVWGVRDWALSHPRLPVLWGVPPGPTTHRLWVRGGWAWGPVTDPAARALASLPVALWRRHEGARGSASCLGVGRPGSGALPTPSVRPSGRAAGAHYPLAVGAGGAGVGTRHRPRSACSCELAWRAVAAARACPGGGVPCLGERRPGSGALPARPPVLWGVRLGPTTHWPLVRGARAWGPVIRPTARTPASWL